MASGAAATVANDQLTAICLRLHANGVSIRELAQAAGVTYRAMYKRLK
jgi:lambda repressor-like predicted transcriptional regulator